MSRKRSKKQVFENIEVLDAGAKGKTVAKAPDGKVIFIPNAVPGDVVDVQTFKKRKAYYEGKATVFHKFSNKRTEPVCEHFGTCGGCKWQDMAYEHQLFYKQKEVTNNLTRIGHIELPEVTPILGSKKRYFYRNKMEFSFSDSRWLTLDEIREKRGLSYGTNSYFLPMQQTGPFIASLSTRNDQVDEAFMVSQEVIDGYLKSGPTDKELALAKKNITGGFPLTIDSNKKLVGTLAAIGFYSLPDDYLDTYIDRVNALDRKEITHALQSVLGSANRVTVIVGAGEK